MEEPEPTIPNDLSFEAGDELVPGSIFAEWVDPFGTNAEFAVAAADNGNGSWSYTDTTNQCTIAFYQGSLTDYAATGTDRTSTIGALAAISAGMDPQITPEIVETYGDEFALDQHQEAGVVSLWGLGADLTDGSSWVNSARYFTANESVYFFSVQCPPGTSAYDEHDRVIGPVGLQLQVIEAGS